MNHKKDIRVSHLQGKKYGVYKEIDPQPINKYERKLAREVAEEIEEVNYETWDMSRPHEKPYTRESYMFAAWIPEDKVDEAKDKIKSVEEEYESKLTKLREKMDDKKDSSIVEQFELDE